MFYYYLVLKKVKDLIVKPTEEYYIHVLHQLVRDPVEIYSTFEYDSRNILHCNSIIIYKTPLMIEQCIGCHAYLQSIGNKSDMFNIMKYIHKDYELKILPHQLI